ncbi:MAG: spore germination protein [Ruminococcus sp.]|nr:spore germination protein [Ruminococcus sp.]
MKENSSIVYFLTRSLFLGYGISLLFLQSSKDSYIGAIIGLIIGFFITYLYTYIIKCKEKQELKDIFKKNKIIGFITRILYFIASLLVFFYAIIIYKLFVVSFLLVKSPEIYITIPFIILALYLAFKDLKVISRVASSLLPIAVIFALVSMLSLTNSLEIDNFLPFLTAKPMSILKTALTFASISAMPNILTLHFKGNTKGYMKMYVLACLFLIITLIFINGIYGEALVKAFRFPEYMVLKQIRLLDFIEKIENILSVMFIFDLFITITMSIYSIKEVIPEYKNKLVTVLILIITIYFINQVFAFNYVNDIRLYYLLPTLAPIVILIVTIPMLYLVKKK